MGDSYSSFTQEKPIADADMAIKWGEICTAIRKNLPSAKCGLDISPWLSETDAPKWFAHFDNQKYDYLFTSGGGTAADNVLIRAKNEMTWAKAHSYGKNRPILADFGYGVNGISDSDGVDGWLLTANAQARSLNGVVGVTVSREKFETDAYIQSTAAVSETQCKFPSQYKSSDGSEIPGDDDNIPVDDSKGDDNTGSNMISFIATFSFFVLAFIF